MHRIVGATVSAEEEGDRVRTGAIGAPEHLRWDYPGSTPTMDRRPMEGGLQVSEWRGRFSQSDGRLHRRPVYASGRFEGQIRGRRLPEC